MQGVAPAPLHYPQGAPPPPMTYIHVRLSRYSVSAFTDANLQPAHLSQTPYMQTAQGMVPMQMNPAADAYGYGGAGYQQVPAYATPYFAVR